MTTVGGGANRPAPRGGCANRAASPTNRKEHQVNQPTATDAVRALDPAAREVNIQNVRLK